MSPWSVLDHTADVGLRVEAESLEAGLADLVEGYASLVCPDGGIEPLDRRTLTIQAPSLEDAVVDLLDELNFINQTEGFLPAGCRVRLASTDGGTELVAELEGEGYDPDKHGHLMEVKATTYHGLVVEPSPARIEVLFDV